MFAEYSWKKESDEEKRIIELQNKIKLNEIQEEDLSEDDRQKVIMLYHKQNEYLRERLRIYKQEISGLLNINK